ncbi:hypothetical protein F3Y22_tig00110239pilonHSYRG00385 [Hibiscus syriacus]|uniref:Lipoxygenase domain-containing protein n=1 Tax=Hibiscus syriacus TaxID=106335 RepID=A0A6A3B8N4_HIBSY|nr:hypothetical protein F3Y22_tig00110239pilonHSYRG00385 [Hibiscus syriacus]
MSCVITFPKDGQELFIAYKQCHPLTRFPHYVGVLSPLDDPNSSSRISCWNSLANVGPKKSSEVVLTDWFKKANPSLPNETPNGLRALREKELRALRGNGQGVRKLDDRVYDFDVYNDLGNPYRGIDFVRPTLGGHKIPYPRRCRTGRLLSETDMSAESRIENPLPMYVPRDEQFEESKRNIFSAGRFRAVLHNLLP